MVAACSGGAPSDVPGARIQIDVAALELPGVTDARYAITVRNDSSEVVATREVTADAYGDGAGGVSYVSPCDADDNDNTVSVELLSLSDAGGTIDPATYNNPGVLTKTATCLANADVAVDFDITIARAATQGFFDVAVSFDDIFCSAKLDCVDQDGDPIELVFNADGERDQTVVLAFACTALGTDTIQYLEDIVVSCDSGADAAVVSPGAGPGNLDMSDPAQVAVTGTNPLFGVTVFRGEEQLGYDKHYWNVALGFEGGTSCRLTTRGTASDGGFGGLDTPAGTIWPIIDWTVDLTNGSGTRVCTRHPVDGPTCPTSGVCTTYTGFDTPATFDYEFNGATVLAGLCAGGVPTVYYPDCDGDGFFDDTNPIDTCVQADAEASLVCAGGTSAPAAVTATPPSLPDCADESADEHPNQVWYPDCDGDGVFDADNGAVQCLQSEADALNLCAASGTPAGGWSHADPPAVDDQCDEDPSGSTLETWWIDCDGDGGFSVLTVDACGSAGTCPGGGDPTSATATDPGFYDCNEGDPADAICDDCVAILTLLPDAPNGDYMVGGDDSAGPFSVTCNMTGGGYMTLVPSSSTRVIAGSPTSGAYMADGILMAESGSTSNCTNSDNAGPDGNPWCKCDDNAYTYYNGHGFTHDNQIDTDYEGSQVIDFAITYTTGGGALTDLQRQSLRSVLAHLQPGDRMIVAIADDDSGDYQSDMSGGHEAYLCLDDCASESPLLLSDGENGNCGGGASSWPTGGTETAFWRWHTEPGRYDTRGQFAVAPSSSTQMPTDYLLPGWVRLVVDTGGGVSYGWQRSNFEVRADTPTSCRDIVTANPTLSSGVYTVWPDDGAPLSVYCEMELVSPTTGQRGFTLLGTIFGGDADNWSASSTSGWGDASTFGSPSTPFAADYKSDAWNRLPLSGRRVLYERRYGYSGTQELRSRVQIAPSCMSGAAVFSDLFANPTGSFITPCDNSYLQVLVPGDAALPDVEKGVSPHYLEGVEGAYGYGLTMSDTNGWCWNGGDTATNTFSGHAGWNQVNYGCYGSGHLGYVGLWEYGGTLPAGGDIGASNWMNYGTVDRTLVGISFYVH